MHIVTDTYVHWREQNEGFVFFYKALWQTATHLFLLLGNKPMSVKSLRKYRALFTQHSLCDTFCHLPSPLCDLRRPLFFLNGR